MQRRRELIQSPRFTLRDLLVECPAFFAMLAFVWAMLALLTAALDAPQVTPW